MPGAELTARATADGLVDIDPPVDANPLAVESVDDESIEVYPADTDDSADSTATDDFTGSTGSTDSDDPAVDAGRSASAAAAPAPYGSRREARERALSLLYEADAKDITPAALLEDIPVEPPPYVTSLVAGVGARRDRIDELIARYAIDWTIDRMPVIDRTVVRMATFELLCRPDVPVGVVISEAVELAKRYSTDESGRFVNGLLASIAAELRPSAGAAGG